MAKIGVKKKITDIAIRDVNVANLSFALRSKISTTKFLFNILSMPLGKVSLV